MSPTVPDGIRPSSAAASTFDTLTGNALSAMSGGGRTRRGCHRQLGRQPSHRPGVRPYLRLARLDRPIGSWLLLIPCWWSLGLAAVHGREPVNVWHAVLFFIGAFAMRGAGCTWNDIVDRDLDAKVERTRSRPIPSGQVSVHGGRGISGACRRWSGSRCCCSSIDSRSSPASHRSPWWRSIRS